MSGNLAGFGGLAAYAGVDYESNDGFGISYEQYS
jgi:hypothetical protein